MYVNEAFPLALIEAARHWERVQDARLLLLELDDSELVRDFDIFARRRFGVHIEFYCGDLIFTPEQEELAEWYREQGQDSPLTLATLKVGTIPLWTFYRRAGVKYADTDEIDSDINLRDKRIYEQVNHLVSSIYEGQNWTWGEGKDFSKVNRAKVYAEPIR